MTAPSIVQPSGLHARQPKIDPAATLRSADNDPEFAWELLECWLDILPGRIAAVHAAVETRDSRLLAVACLALSVSAEELGLLGVARAAAKLGRQHQQDPAMWHPGLIEILDQTDHVRRRVGRHQHA